MTGMLHSFLFILVLIFTSSVAAAQVPPSASQIDSYQGLHKASHEGDSAAVEKLIAAKKDLNTRDASGRTPLMVAAFASRYDVAEMLLKAGADHRLLEQGKYDAVTIAAVKGDARMVRTLIERGASAALTTSIYDGTALIAAAHLGHADVVKALIDGGAPLDHVNNLGWTAVIEAIVLGDGGKDHVNTLRHLVKAGADVNIADRSGTTPLKLAETRGYAEMVKMLKEAGAR